MKHKTPSGVWPFLAGLAAGGAAVLASQRRRRPRLHPRIVRALARDSEAPFVVFVPGLCGSQLLRPDGSEAWLNLGNTLGHHDLRLPGRLPLAANRDDLHPGLLIGSDALLPRAFGFTEYAEVLDLLDGAGFEPGVGPGPRYAVFSYDWRRDLVESARHLALRLEGLARALGDDHARFHLIGHSMGGLVVRYYLRHGGAEPRAEQAVSWAGARRTASATLVATPNGGSIPALAAILDGERVGFSHTTLAATVVRRMPSVYQLLPPAGTGALAGAGGEILGDDVQDPATWERYGWGPFVAGTNRRDAEEVAFVTAALERARAFHAALSRPAASACPVPVYAVGGDCLLTAARAVVGEGKRGASPRFDARSPAEQDRLYEPGDGRVTRASLLGSHLPQARASQAGCGYQEVGQAFFGASDHHGLYGDPAVQSLLLRLLLRPAGRPAAGHASAVAAARRAVI